MEREDSSSEIRNVFSFLGYDFNMRTAEYPFIADWLVITLRWLVLLGITASAGMGAALGWSAAAVLLFLICWNIFATFLAIFNRRLPLHRLINVVVDFISSLLLFVFTGGLLGPLTWAGLLVVLSAAIYYELWGGLLVALTLSLLQSAYVYVKAGSGLNVAPMGIVLVFNAASGALLGWLGRLAMRGVRSNYQNQLALRKENERKVQRQERSRLQTFYRMVETLSSTLSYELVLNTTLDLGLEALGMDKASSGEIAGAVFLFGEGELYIGAARGIPQRDLRMTFPAQQGVLYEAVQSGEPQQAPDAANDPELSRLVALHDCKSCLCLPMRRGLSAFGVMLFAHRDAQFFTPERCELLEMVSHQAVIAIQNARLYQELEQEKERIIETQEEAQKKLARDLHDGPTQAVAAIAMQADIARKLFEQDPQQVPAELGRIEELARRTTQEIRHMLFTLRPLVLESEGLIAALQTIAEKMGDTYQQNVVIEAEPAVVEQLEIARQSVIFSIVEEAVNNARKHAEASQIVVRLRFMPKNKSLALLEVSDNGRGFDVKSIAGSYDRRGSLGMVNLRERADLVNGLLHIESLPGKGTKIYVLIPLTEEAADRLQRGLPSVE